MRGGLDQSTCGEQADRFTHRRARHREAARHLGLVERGAGLQHAAHDFVGELQSQRFGERLPPALARARERRDAHAGFSSIRLTCAATTCQPSGKRTQVCIWRPTLPGTVTRWNSVEAVAKSCP